MNVAAKVAADKQAHPEQFCPVVRCLWRTHGGFCPRHEHLDPDRLVVEASVAQARKES